MPKLLIIIHDVSPVFKEEVAEIFDALSNVGSNAVSAAVVPDWHGLQKTWTPDFVQSITQNCGELLLHGMYHHQPFPLKNTFNEWEFLQLPLRTARERIALGQGFFEHTFQRKALGFVPPAWQSGALNARLLSESGIEYTLGFQYFESQHQRASVRTWSWDWGPKILGNFPRLFTFFSSKGSSRVQVVIHPKDVRNGFLKAAINKVKTLQDSGYTATLPKQLLA